MTEPLACLGSYNVGCRCFDCVEERRVYKAMRRLIRGEAMHVNTGELCEGCRGHLAERIKTGPLTNVRRVLVSAAGRFTA